MYPLERGLWGPTARITRIRDALAGLVRLDVLSGTRGERVGRLVRYVASGRLRSLEGIYVESSTALPGPMDLAFLALARAIGVPVLTYVRDAYQLSTEYYPIGGIKTRLVRSAFRPAMRVLALVSSRVAYPSNGLAAMLTSERDPLLIPPGARLGAAIPLMDGARDLLYVGTLRQEAQGGPILLGGVALAREQGCDIGLICVCRPGEEPPGGLPPWAELVRAEGDAIDALLPRVLATVIPRRASAYNDLALPIKLMDYLGYGRPLIVTDVAATARVVREAGAGLVVTDSAAGIAQGIAALLGAPAERRAAWASAARAAAASNTWTDRARLVLTTLGVAQEAA
jgi:glycosyltransferase involved in cell wall biosynthesis